ncbi:MAG: hypothetical protein JWO09_2220 [Bacteroidetes bacterium]|nr:hypothetical protein [Bacteroidota bacterium]
MYRGIVFFLIFYFVHGNLFSQHKENEFLDSTYIYRKIEDFSNKRKATRLLYSLVFRPINPKPVTTPVISKIVLKPVKYAEFEGKIIRYIQIITYDPFGYDSRDTSVTPHGIVPKAGNAVHIKTWPKKIKDVLLVKKYDTFDSLRVKESERLIRSQSYVREVYMEPVHAGDSVDLFIRVYDVWSIIITGSATTTAFSLNGRDKNFLGAGHQFQGDFRQNVATGKNNYSAVYTIPNLYDTYINSTVRYTVDENKNYVQGISLNRSFYSVFTAWAGGATLQRSQTKEIMYELDSTAFMQVYRNNLQDYWIGRSWQLFRGKTEEKRTTSLISSLRYMRSHYPERAPTYLDTLRLHANEDFYLVGVGLSKRLYKQDNYIFRYGYVEDVPTGRAYSVVGGYQIKDNIPRWYAGARVYMANYHNWGYFNIYFEYGTFIRKQNTEEGSFSAGINYFSNIIRIGRWRLRQFIKPQYIIGFDRQPYENLSLNNDAALRGFNSTGLSGKERFSLTFQLQSYAPWNILGFRFGPYVICGFGMLGSEKSGFTRAPLYSFFGIGLLIKNEYLILTNFQISLAFYPSIPGVGNNVFKVNPVKTTDFGFRGFDISQPAAIGYN